MQKANKAKGKIVKNAASGNLTGKTKNGKTGKATYPQPPFAHRTPTQLHASVYAHKNR